MLPQRCHGPQPQRHGDTSRTTLSPLERQVVGIARIDTLASLREDRPVRRITRKLTGARRPNTLADPRLEALRRFAVIAHRDAAAIDDDEINRMREAGFSVSQMDEACGLVDRAPPGSSRWGAIIVAIVSTILVAVAGFTWLHATLDDPLIAAVMTGALLLPLLPSLLSGTTR